MGRIFGQFSIATHTGSPAGVQIDRRIAQMLSFTFSIANGAVFGFISFTGLKLLTGHRNNVPLIVWIIAAIFVFRYIYLGAE